MIIPLHWAVVFLVLALSKDGVTNSGLHWAFVGIGALWLILAAMGGPLGRPGPKLTGAFRVLFVPFHLAVYLTLAIAVVMSALAQTGRVAHQDAWLAHLALFAIGALHGIFHLWRHTALRDGALRMILPRAMHRHL